MFFGEEMGGVVIVVGVCSGVMLVCGGVGVLSFVGFGGDYK